MNLILISLGAGLPASARAFEPVAAASEALHAVRGGCEDVRENDARAALARSAACFPSAGSLSNLADISNVTAEERLFLALAAQNARELACGADYGDQLATRDGPARADVVKKLGVMRWKVRGSRRSAARW